jgi:hypothetical protein
MRILGTLALLAAAACGGSAASSETTPAPATSAATMSSAATNPCSGGDCTVNVEVGSDVEREFQRRQTIYKVYAGCPRQMGLNNSKGDSTAAAGLRGREPLTQSRTSPIAVPASLTGRFATVAMFFGATPMRYLVVDLGARKNATANFGYRWDASKLADDLTIVNTNNSFMARTCR